MTFRLGLIGHPVKHSLSPPMHKAALKFFGLEGDYELIDIQPEQLAERVKQLIQSGYSGFNVTIPHKEAMFKLASYLTHEASSAGVANTIAVGNDGTLTAHNTDIAGCQRSLASALSAGNAVAKPGSSRHIQQAVLVGAGGAARAALIALANLGCEETVVIARDVRKAKEWFAGAGLPNKVEVRSLPCEPLNRNVTRLVVQTTPIGLRSVDIPGWFDNILFNFDERETSRAPRPLFFDMVYSREVDSTPLVQLARQRGWHAIDGTDMLVHQACLAFEFWTGKLPPFELMKSALETARTP